MMKSAPAAYAAVAALCLVAARGLPQDANQRLRENLKDDIFGSWVYDDIEGGYAEAKKSGKPLMVVFR